ncbi:hypothetical protein HPB49_022188 [Dermacentor silvarum]|uniref:Uncharacterized protein n=1 Tax=Dermacentor silvarum TaxID=543639 RepID=A0ACB8D8F6_DERSI|nr:hypothetical protein HPB49_022188 [Dermacentor silvarum]
MLHERFSRFSTCTTSSQGSTLYDISRVIFSSEKLETFNWSYLDHTSAFEESGSMVSRRLLNYAFSVKFTFISLFVPELQSVGAWVRASGGPMRLSISHQGSPLTTSPQSGPVSAITASTFRDRVSSNRIHDRPRSLHTEHLRADVMPVGKMTPATDSDSKKLVEESYICHASGDVNHPFINGFYIYSFPDKNTKENYEVDLDAYQHEWIEVELLPQNEHSGSAGELDSTEIDIGKKLEFRNVNVDIDVGGRSDRPEWGQAQYHTIFQPGEAFEIIVEWMVATGYIIADLVLGWARKANSQGLQLVPIPSDPFVLPESPKSDPLRGGGLEQFQEYVAHRFGFITLRDLQSTVEHRTYVHTTGGMFLMIPRSSPSSKPSPSDEADKSLDYICCEADVMEHCLKHCEEPPPACTNRKVGFLWSYNYMITKRWKNTATIDEQFMRGVMQDFRALCSNHEGRLVEAFEAWLCTWCVGAMQGSQAAELFPQIEQ